MPYKDRARQNEYQARWQRERRAAWLAENGPCVDCGSWDELEVDHEDPSTKVAHNIWSWSAERRNAELSKCRPRCAACHLEKSNRERASKAQHGDFTKYARQGCRCDLCRRANRDHSRIYRARTGRTSTFYNHRRKRAEQTSPD